MIKGVLTIEGKIRIHRAEMLISRAILAMLALLAPAAAQATGRPDNEDMEPGDSMSAPKEYFHAQPYAYDSDCHGCPCWTDAEGRPVARRIIAKTNIPAWGMLWQNAAVEIDILPHFSFELPVYWSPYDYGKRTLKFRTFSAMPKFRYWPSADNDGFFVDIHGGFAYYNVALGGDKRYQDHDGDTPALGGGIGLGYRFRLPGAPRWKIELALGAGVYALDYDIFENTRNGLITDRRRRTFFGIDNFAVSLCYEFYVRPRSDRKGGAR